MGIMVVIISQHTELEEITEASPDSVLRELSRGMSFLVTGGGSCR